MSTERYELTRSIIHKCPALKLPQTFLQKLGMTAQIVPLLGLTDEQAKALVDRLNSAPANTPHMAQFDREGRPINDAAREMAKRWGIGGVTPCAPGQCVLNAPGEVGMSDPCREEGCANARGVEVRHG